jgi:signal peptidase
MEPDIMAGDLIFCKKIDPDDVRIDDVISFFDPDGDGQTIITHKVYDIEIDEKTGERAFRTYGINNNTKDWLPVPEENVVGIWNGTRFWQLGAILLFTQSIPGILVCVILPIAALVVYELLRRRKQDAKKQDDIEKLKAELEAMKAGNAAPSEEKSEKDEPLAKESDVTASDEAKPENEQG